MSTLNDQDKDVAAEENWMNDLAAALRNGCDFTKIRSIAKGRPLNSELRTKAWQILAGVFNKPDPFISWDGLYDLKEQILIRTECKQIIENFGNEKTDKLGLQSDVESVLTLYCKTREFEYSANNGWSEILTLFLSLNLTRQQLYHLFFAFTTKYIPRHCVRNGKPFDLFRLLLLYHDPELCSFLDTRKITPDMYAMHWFTTLFAQCCSLDVTLMFWDVYLQHADPFQMLYMALVFLMNAKEQVLDLSHEEPSKIAATIACLPCQLSAEDIPDFCQLAAFYSSKTPQSFRRDYHGPIFGSNLTDDVGEVVVHSLLCLPVSVQELLQANKRSFTSDEEGNVRYFVVDGRPPKHYTNGHLSGSYNLDASMIVNNPTEFALAVASLCAFKQKTHPGEHICFLGSGREEEDQYLHMVIAYFLQKGLQYVSLARGGYAALHELLRESLSTSLKLHNVRGCLVCKSNTSYSLPNLDVHMAAAADTIDTAINAVTGKVGLSVSVLSKLSSVVKSKSSDLKNKVSGYIANSDSPEAERHALPSDRLKGKEYRKTSSVFSIDDQSDSESDADSQSGYSSLKQLEKKERVKIAAYVRRQEVQAFFPCNQILLGPGKKTIMVPSYIVVTGKHVVVIQESEDDANWGYIRSRHRLQTVSKITSKKKMPELLSFRYTIGSADPADGDELEEIVERFHIVKAGDCAKAIKNAIFRLRPENQSTGERRNNPESSLSPTEVASPTFDAKFSLDSPTENISPQPSPIAELAVADKGKSLSASVSPSPCNSEATQERMLADAMSGWDLEDAEQEPQL